MREFLCSCLQQLNCTVFKFLLLGFIFFLPQVSKAQTQIFKGNNTNALDQGSSWVGGVVPTSGNVIVYNNTNSSSSTAPVGAGLSVAGIFFSTNPSANITINAGTGALSLGASGIDIRASTSRTLTIAAPINLTADQTWYTGLANTNTVMITANGAISGAGKLTIGGAVNSSNQFVLLNGANTFSGGLTLNDGGAVRGGSTGATVSGTSVTASSYGTGPLTINGGTIFGNAGAVGFTTITINGDFSVNKAHWTAGGSSANARLRIGGRFDLGSQTRTISVGSYSNSVAGVLVGGNESLSFLPLSTTAGPSNTVANGVIRLVRDQSGIDGTDYANVNFGAGGMIFSSGSGMTIGKGIVTSLSTGNPFGTTAFNQPVFTVETGGIFNLSDGGNARSPTIRALTGPGVVTALGSNATAGTISTLTINSQTGDSYEFSGSISDGASTGLVPTANMKVALTKSSAGLQILSGSNNMSGAISVTGGELRFMKRNSLYSGNTSLWTNLSVTNATLGLSLGGAEGFASSDLDILVANTNIMKTGSKLGLDVASSNGPVTLSTVLSNSANSNGITFSKSGNGQLNLSGYTGTYTNPVTISGGTLKFTQLSTYSGTPAITGGGVLDLSGATFPIPNTVTLTDGSIVNFNPGDVDPFAPTANVSYTGFSFAVDRLNDGTNGARTFTLTNSVLTVGGEVATNGFTISGASNGVMRLTGQTLGQGNTNVSKGQINVLGSAILEFASNSVFDSYRPLSINSAFNPTVLVSGGSVSNLSYVLFGQSAGNTGTLRMTSGSLAVVNPNPSGNGLYFGQNGGSGTFSLEGGSASTTVLKVQSGTANINISGGTLNLVTTNAVTNPAGAWSLSQNGTVNFNMTGGSIVATNSKFNLSSGNSSNFLTNVVYAHDGGVIRSVEMSAGAGSFTMDGGTNESSAGMFVGDNPNGAVLFTQNNGLVRIKGEAGSSAGNDLVIGFANGNGTYVLNGGVLEVFGKIRKNSGTSSLILNGGAIRYTNSTNQTAFISSYVDTTVGTGGAIFEITDSNVTNSIQATLNDVSGQVGKLVKRGAGTLAIGRGNLGYSGSTKVEDGTLSVTDTNAGYAARISRDQVIMEFASAPAGPTSTFQILPSSLEDGTSRISANGLAANQQISFDPSTSIATVVTAAGPTDPYELWAQGSPLTSETLLRYALGGASSPTSDDAQPTTVRRSGNDLVLSVVVRANDLTLTYQPQTSDDLSPDSWMNTNAPYTLPVSQGVPENFERREYSVPGTNPRLFLRIQVTK